MPDEETPLSPLTVFLWMFIADIVLQEGGQAIDMKVIFDEISSKRVPSNTNEAYNHALLIRSHAKALVVERALKRN